MEQLQRRVEEVKCDSKEKLEEAIERAKAEVDPVYLRNLVHSMPKRCKAVIEAKGDHTEY